MTNPVDPIHFDDLAALDPQDVCRRVGCSYDHEKQCFSLRVWDDEYTVYPHDFRIDRTGQADILPHDYFPVFVIHYLLGGQPIDIHNRWVSEKDIPGGTAFFRGPHEVPTHLIAGRYDGQMATFKHYCEQLGGRRLDMADAAYAFRITPRIPVAVLYWERDEEFPAESKLLFDPTISEHMALDAIYALAVEVCTRVGKAE
jgi:hypothetical protein